MGTIRLVRGIEIAEGELRFEFDRSEGPGGQNVNKVATRAKLLFDLAGTAALSETQKEAIRKKLPNRITRAGVLQIVCGRHRTQAQNRREAVERFIDLMNEALRVRPVRRPTRPTAASKRRRLEAKRQRSERKSLRGSRGLAE